MPRALKLGGYERLRLPAHIHGDGKRQSWPLWGATYAQKEQNALVAWRAAGEDWDRDRMRSAGLIPFPRQGTPCST